MENIFKLDPVKARELVASLTYLERQVVSRYVMGLPRKEIVAELGLGVRSADYALDRVQRKFRRSIGLGGNAIPRVWFCAAEGVS